MNTITINSNTVIVINNDTFIMIKFKINLDCQEDNITMIL